MTELEKIGYAKMYMDKLAEGIDPVSGEVLPEDTVLNNVHLTRCFYFTSDILRRVIENEGVGARKSRKKDVLPPFTLSDDLRKQIEITVTPAMISHIAARINSLIDENSMQKLKVTAFTTWLMNNELLCEEIVDSKKRKKPTKTGEELGIFSEDREGQYGRYLAILYSETAQRYLLNNLDQIIAISNGEKKTDTI